MSGLSAVQPLPWVALAALVGAVAGSFLNVVVHRLPRMLEARWRRHCAELIGDGPSQPREGEAVRFDLAWPPSHCPHCQHRLGWLENLPLLSYLALKGHCRHCGAPIGLRYFLVEAAAAVAAAACVGHFGVSLAAAAAMLLAWTLIALTAIDLDTQLLPDDLTLPLLWLGLAVNLGGVFTDLSTAVIGAMAGYLFLWSVYWLFRLATGKEGMGYGDFKLLAALGAWLGWKQLPVIVLLSSLTGAVVGIALMVFARYGRDRPIPFGPYLALGGLIALFFGERLVTLWLAP